MVRGLQTTGTFGGRGRGNGEELLSIGLGGKVARAAMSFVFLGVVYMSQASPVSRTNSLNEILITATDTQNDISKQNWLSLTVGRA